MKITKLEQIQEINSQENNLFYLYGKTGSGKTYLVKELAKQRGEEIFYTNFTQMIQNISNETYLNQIGKGIVVMDDKIAQIVGREVTCLKIQQMLKKIQSKGNILIIVSTVSPKELGAISSSFINFILSGVQIEVCYDIETRIKIAEEYNKQNQLKIEKGILESMVKKEENLGKIRGMMNQMSINYETD